MAQSYHGSIVEKLTKIEWVKNEIQRISDTHTYLYGNYDVEIN